MDKIIILDYGSQYTQLIARRIREQHVYSEIVPYTISAARVREIAPKGVILSGGPNSVFEEGAPGIDRAIFELGIPVLGVCYGMQLMSQELGGEVRPGERREYGKTEMTVEPGNVLFRGLPDRFVVWMSHGDRVSAIPASFKVSATSANCPFAAVRDEARNFFGIQFHPEVVHTEHGKQILSNFIFLICGAKADWQLTTWIEDTVRKLKEQIGDDEVVLGLSGGVDSSVAAVLLDKAIGGRLHCIFVDNGLLRYREAEQVEEMFGKNLGLDLTVARAADRFYAALKGLDDPEAKRKAIGKTFIDVFAEEARRFRHCRFLGQGTIYPDVIESSHAVKGPSQTIKSHHNVGGLPPDLKFELVEPSRPPAVPRSGSRRPNPRGSDEGKGRTPPAGRPPRPRGNEEAPYFAFAISLRLLALADLRGPAPGPFGRRDGRPAHVRVHVCDPFGQLHRRDDGRLDAPSVRGARDDVEPHHQRGPRHQPRRLRHLLQTSGHDRMGMRDRQSVGTGEARTVLDRSRPR